MSKHVLKIQKQWVGALLIGVHQGMLLSANVAMFCLSSMMPLHNFTIMPVLKDTPGVFRRHPDAQTADEVARLHALLLMTPATRGAATQLVIQQMIHTVQRLSVNVAVTAEDTHATGSAAISTGSPDDASGEADDEIVGLHDQLSSISTCIAAVDVAVTDHCNAAICLAVWKQTIHLAPPTGKSNCLLLELGPGFCFCSMFW